MSFSINQYDSAVVKWMEQNVREVLKYGDGLHKKLADETFAHGLPTVISVGLSFKRLQAAGALRRVDGHDAQWDNVAQNFHG
jgi:hypothetical protein